MNVKSPLTLNYDSTWKMGCELHIPAALMPKKKRPTLGPRAGLDALEGRIMVTLTRPTSITFHTNFNLLTIAAVLTRLLTFRMLL